MQHFKQHIHAWYARHKRDLPWRETTSPYYIWLSEIILQQTRVVQGIDYYYRFTERFPALSDLANADEEEVLKLWQGLGYYSRARNLHQTAKDILLYYNGIFPADYAALKKLKGIGDYTASAIASIAFNLPYAAVDGNVFRVLSRFFGIALPIDSREGEKAFRELANELIRKENAPGMHNQAMMEFGALQCVPAKPDCNACPLADRCFALQKGQIDQLPVKKNKTKVRDRYFNYLVIEENNFLFLQKRTKKDIWMNLYEFPLIETSEKVSVESLLDDKNTTIFNEFKNLTFVAASNWQTHLLSHQKIHYRFIQLQTEESKKIRDSLLRVDKKDIFTFAVPKLIEKFVNKIMHL